MDEKTIRVRKNVVDEALEMYEQIRKRTINDGLSMFLFQELWRQQRAQLVQRDQPARRESEASQAGANRLDEASAKQIRFLESLGVRLEMPYKLSKQEASRMLNERLGGAA
jgi:hypothetical protein